MKKILFTFACLLTCWAAVAQWTDDPLVNNRVTKEEAGSVVYHFDYGATKDGLSYVVTNKPIDGNIATILQIVDKNGVNQFPGDGTIISHEETWPYLMVGQLLFVDKDGNALLPVADCKNSNAGGLSYRVYKVSPAGEHLWNPEGIPLDSPIPLGFQSKMNIIQLEDGSYVLAYIWSEDGKLPVIRLHRLSKNGELQESLELKEDAAKYDFPYVTNTGYGQFALVYTRNGVLTAQKYDFDLTPLWSRTTRIYTGPFPASAPLQNVLSVLPDPKGGVFVAWYDDRDGDQIEAVHVAHVKPNGELGFTGAEGGEKVSLNNYRAFRPQMNYDEKNDCLYVIWNEADGAQTYQRLMIQKIKPDGEFVWEPGGLLLQDVNREGIGNYSVRSAEGQPAVFYMIQHANYTVSSFVTLIDGATGDFVWEDEKVEFSTNISRKLKLVSSPLIDNSYWLTIWGDNRAGISNDYPPLYMQKINRDASLGGTPTTIRTPGKENGETFRVTPSYVKEAAQFAFENPQAGTVDISIYTLSGQKTVTVFHGNAAQGARQIPWNKPSTLDRGVYIARLTDAEGTQKTTQIIIY
jgi:hypothetical protein